MADRRPGPNFKPAAPSRTAPPPLTGLSSAGAGAGARVGASVRRNLFQQPQSQPAQASRQSTAAPDTQSQGPFQSQSFQSQISQTSHSQIHQSNFQAHPPQPQAHYQQASYLTHPSSYSYSYSYPQDLLSDQYQQLPQPYEEDTKMTSSQESQPSTDAITDPNLEIVIRDKETGEIDLDNDPPTPPYDEEMETILEARMEQEKERERLADAVREWLTEREAEGRGDVGSKGAGGGGGEGAGVGGGGGMDTEDLLEAVKASLKAKVAALSEDNWMFEREEVLHLH